jgi:hypothetical protein
MTRYSSPIPSSVPDDDDDIYAGKVSETTGVESDPDTSGADWSGPENQLGLEQDDRFDLDQAVGLDEEGETD